MADQHALAYLRERLEKATGADGEIDKLLWYRLIFDPTLDAEGTGWLRLVGSGYPHYTASIDAALALVERVLPNWSRFIGDLDPDDMRAVATIAQGRPDQPSYRGFAPPRQYALALCKALIEALIAKGEG